MTIQFARVGDPKKDGTYQVYLRYMYKQEFTGKNEYEYIPTGHSLTDNQLTQLMTDKLSGKMNLDLHLHKKKVEDIVVDYHEKYHRWPTKEQIIKGLEAPKVTTIDYFSQYRQDIKSTMKQSSFDCYVTMIQTLTERLQELEVKDKKKYCSDALLFANEITTKRLLDYHVELGRANGYIRPLMRMVLRIQNFIRKKAGKDEIVFAFRGLKSTYKKYILNEEEIGFLVDFKTDKVKFKVIQDLIRINSLIGLRIEELLSIECEDIEFKSDRTVIQIFERKKSLSRQVIISNESVISILRARVKQMKEGKIFDIDKDDVNYRLKALAKATGKFDNKIRITKNVGNEVLDERKYKWELLSSHSIRKFAITKNAASDLLVAQYYSGHKNLETIQKHYLAEMSEQVIFGKLKKLA